MKKIGLTLVAAFAMLVVAAGSAGAAITPVPVYNGSYAGPLPGNLPSVGAEAYSFKEFGDEVTFAGTQRTLGTVRVTMSSWACELGTWANKDCVSTPGDKFHVPITLNIYNASSHQGDGTVLPGSLITTATHTFSIPYRPTANLKHCNSGNSNTGKWWQGSTSTCFNGKAANITFNFKSLGITLPADVVIGIAYNTSHYGYSPIGETPSCYSTEAGCPYDSLNIGLGPTVLVGSEPNPGTVFQNAVFGSDYCDSTPLTNVFNQDSPTSTCWSGYVPAMKVTAY